MMKRVVLAALGLAVLVVLSSCARAVHAYFSGTAVIMFSGYPGRGGWSLDAETRAPFRSQGCRVPFFEPLLVHVPNNLTLVLLARTLGPMPGTYHGPYPTRDEAAEALRNAPVVYYRLAGSEWPAGIDCDGVRATLHAEAPELPAGGGFARMRCALFKEQTLLLGDAHEARLFDRKTGRHYALYFFPLPSELQLDGAWSGNEELRLEGGATRSTPFQVTFEGTGGSYTFHGQGSTPLLAVRQRDNAVEFDVESRGRIHHYAGTWDGQSIAGTVGKRRFSLFPAL